MKLGVFDMLGEAVDTVSGPLSSIVKNVFMDTVNPVPGSIVRTDLMCGLFSHTGVYVGKNQIIEITDIGGKAKVQSVSVKGFLSGGVMRTGVYIYVAAGKSGDELYPLASREISERARKACGGRGKYFTMCNNCLQFTRYCITGEDDETSTPWTVDDIVEALKSKYGVDDVYWRSTGLVVN